MKTLPPLPPRMPKPPPVVPRYDYLPPAAIAVRTVITGGVAAGAALMWLQLDGASTTEEAQFAVFARMRFLPVLGLLNLPAYVCAPAIVVPIRTISRRQALVVSVAPLLFCIGVGLLRFGLDWQRLLVVGAATVPAIAAVLALAFSRTLQTSSAADAPRGTLRETTGDGES